MNEKIVKPAFCKQEQSADQKKRSKSVESDKFREWVC